MIFLFVAFTKKKKVITKQSLIQANNGIKVWEKHLENEKMGEEIKVIRNI